MTEKGVKGRIGEEKALRWLLDQGYALVERNFRAPGGEVDLIVESGPLLVFVEVKYRLRSYPGAGLEAVTVKKQRSILAAAGQYLVKTNQFSRPLRFDVAEVTDEGVRYIENAFSGAW